MNKKKEKSGLYDGMGQGAGARACNMNEKRSCCCMLYVRVRGSKKKGKAGFKDTSSNFDDFKHKM